MPSAYAPCPNCAAINRVSLEAAAQKSPVCGVCKAHLPIHDGVNELNGTRLSLLVQKSPLPVVADFWAPWCGPCKSFAPIFQQAARNLAGEFVFGKINTQEHPLAGDTFHIRGIPTVVVFQNGLEQTRQSGAMPLDYFVEWLRGTVRHQQTG